jgi:hypothetical protein
VSRFAAPVGGAVPAAPPAAAARRARAELAAAVVETRIHRDVTVHGTQVRGRMRALSRAEARQVRADCRAALKAAGIEAAGPGVLEGYVEYREELVLRSIAIAVRDPGDVEQPLAPLEEWESCNDQQLGALWDDLRDLEAETDPYGDLAPPLSEADEAALADAAKKKDKARLMSFGSHTLARFAITSVAARTT